MQPFNLFVFGSFRFAVRDIEVAGDSSLMACIVESYNPALAPSSASIAIPESLRAKLGAETLFVSPRALHSLALSQDLCSPEHSLHSSSSSTVEAVETSPGRLVGIATRAEPSPHPCTAERLSQLGRPSAALAAHIHLSMRQREEALPSLQLASPQLHKRCVNSIIAMQLFIPLQNLVSLHVVSYSADAALWTSCRVRARPSS